MIASIILLSAAALSSASGTPESLSLASTTSSDFLAKNYPAESLKRGEQGRVGFTLSFDTNGGVKSCLVTQSSGYQALDQATCELLSRSAKGQQLRDAKGRLVAADRTGYINWKLAGAEPAPIIVEVASRRADPMVCQQSDVTGSLARKVKRCMRKSEWAMQERIAKEAYYQKIQSNRCNPHGCD